MSILSTNKKLIRIDVTAHDGDPEAQGLVRSNSATWDSVINKLDTTAFSDVSGSFLTAVDLSNYYTKSETSGASEIADALANIPTGNPEVENYVQTNSANIDETVNEYKTNSSTYMVEPNLEYNSQGYINGYNGSAFAAGGIDIEFGYTDADTISSINTSAITDVSLNNIVQTNSGVWGGSALPISAGPGIKINLVDNTLVFSNDETLLASSTDYYGAGELNLSESLKNFERIKILATRGNIDQSAPYGFSGPWIEFETEGIRNTAANVGAVTPFIFEGPFWKYGVYTANEDFTKITWWAGGQKKITSTEEGTTADSFTAAVGIKAVLGINRK